MKRSITNPYSGCKSPCRNCPYRKDAPKQLWAKEEFSDLMANDRSQMGTNYMCHKKNGNACTGWLLNQRERRYPSIMLRIGLMRNNITAEFLESLHCPTPMFKSIEEMAHANYPETFPACS